MGPGRDRDPQPTGAADPRSDAASTSAPYGWFANVRLTAGLDQLRATAGADVRALGAGRLRITPLDGSSEPVDVRLVRGHPATDGSADLLAEVRSEGDRTTIVVSDGAPLSAARRALAGAVAELVASRRPVADGAPEPEFTPAEEGRLAEVRHLGRQLREGGPLERAAALAALPALLDGLGLTRPAPDTRPAESAPDDPAPAEPTPGELGYARRWAALPEDLRPLVRAVNDVVGPGAAPTAVSSSWHHTVRAVAAALPALLAQSVALGVHLAVGSTAGAAGAGASISALAAATSVNARLERDFARLTEQRAALAEGGSPAPAAARLLDARAREVAEQALAADRGLLDELRRQTGRPAGDLSADLPLAPESVPAGADPGERAAPIPSGARAAVLPRLSYLNRYGLGPTVAAGVGAAVNLGLAAALGWSLLPAVAALGVGAAAGYATAFAERWFAGRKADLQEAKKAEAAARSQALELARAEHRTRLIRTQLRGLESVERGLQDVQRRVEDTLDGRPAADRADAAPTDVAAPAAGQAVDVDVDALRAALAARAAAPGNPAARDALDRVVEEAGLAATRLTDGRPPGQPLTIDDVTALVRSHPWIPRRAALPEDVQTALEAWDDAGQATPGVAAHLPKWAATLALPAAGGAVVTALLAPHVLVTAVLPAVTAAATPLAAWADRRFSRAAELAEDRSRAARGPSPAVVAARAAHDAALADAVARAQVRVEARRTALAAARARLDLAEGIADRAEAVRSRPALTAGLAAVPPPAPTPDIGSDTVGERADAAGSTATAPVAGASVAPVPRLGEYVLRYGALPATAGAATAGTAAAALAAGGALGRAGLSSLSDVQRGVLLGGVTGLAGLVTAPALVAAERRLGEDVARRREARTRSVDEHAALLAHAAREADLAALRTDLADAQAELDALAAEVRQVLPTDAGRLGRGTDPHPPAPRPDAGAPASPATREPVDGDRAPSGGTDWARIVAVANATGWERRPSVPEGLATLGRGVPAAQPPAAPGGSAPGAGPVQPGGPPSDGGPAGGTGPDGGGPSTGSAPGSGSTPTRPGGTPAHVPDGERPAPPGDGRGSGRPGGDRPGPRPAPDAGGAPGGWRDAQVERVLVTDLPGQRTVSLLVTLRAPDGSLVRLLVRVLLSVHGQPVVLIADADGVPQPGMIAPVAALLAGLPPHGTGLPTGPWAPHAMWGVLCPAAPGDRYGLLREVEVDWQGRGPRFTGRTRVLPAPAAAALYAERHVRPVEDVLAELVRAAAPVP